MTASAEAPAGEGRIAVGLVRGLHGLRGAVRVEVLTDDPARFEPGSVLWPADSERRLTVLESRSDNPPGLIVRFREIRDRAAAEALREKYLEAEPAELPPGSHYWHEIEGLRVVSETGAELGRVEDIFRVGEAEVYVVRGPAGELLVPAVKSVVRELSPEAGQMVVDTEALGVAEKQ